MTTNRMCYLITSIAIGIILVFTIGIIIYFTHRDHHHQRRINYSDTCPRPNQYANNYDYDYTKNSRERRINNTIDYFRLSFSWSPTFCHEKNPHAKNSFQCQHSFGFIVHGLWPSKIKQKNISNSLYLHPRNCRNENQMSIEIIKKYFCLMPSEHLMQAEWEKHGTCYWQNPEDYFEQIYHLYSKIHLPNNITEILNNQTISKRLRHDSIKEKFLELNPELTSEYIDVIMIDKGRKLKEVHFCYDHQFNHIKCN